MSRPPINMAMLIGALSGCKFKHGCVVYRGTRRVIDCNKDRYDKRLRAYGYKKCYLHAESATILRASGDWMETARRDACIFAIIHVLGFQELHSKRAR